MSSSDGKHRLGGNKGKDDGKEWYVTLPVRYEYEEIVDADRPLTEEEEANAPKNIWCSPPGSCFTVRGPNYDVNGSTNNVTLKAPSLDPIYECLGCNVFQSATAITPATKVIKTLREYLDDAHKNEPRLPGDEPQYMVIVFIFSDFWRTEHTATPFLFKRKVADVKKDAPSVYSAFQRFLKGSDQEKNEQFKLVAKVLQCAPILKSTIATLGGERPVIIGKKLTTKYYHGPNYLEVQMDVASSTIANMLNSVVLKSSGHFCLDLSFLLEGQNQAELPERVLCALRANHVSFDDCRQTLDANGEVIVDTDVEGSDDDFQ